MGQQYAERYPRRVRALVLDSVIDHSLDTRSYLDTRAAFAQDAFDEFVAWNDRDPASPLHGLDVRALWTDLLARADRGELPDPAGIPLTRSGLVALAFTSLTGPHSPAPCARWPPEHLPHCAFGNRRCSRLRWG